MEEKRHANAADDNTLRIFFSLIADSFLEVARANLNRLDTRLLEKTVLCTAPAIFWSREE
jgi:hypothetical protein